MHSTRTAIGSRAAFAVAVLAIALVLGKDVPPTRAAAQSGIRVVTVFETGDGGTFAFVDNAPHSPDADPQSPAARFSTGDQAYWTGDVLDRKGGKHIGEIYGMETVLRGTTYPNVTNLIHAIFALDGGSIFVEAVVDETHQDRVAGAVVGGTGAYVGARGTFRTKPGRDGNTDTFTLLA